MSCHRRLAGALFLALAVANTAGMGRRTDAATLTKADNALPLVDPASWTINMVPIASDTALFDSTLTGPLSVSLGSNLTLVTLRITNPAGAITLGGAYSLTLGGQTGIDMSGATVPLTMNHGLIHALNGAQTWNIATVLTLHGNFTATNGNVGRALSLTGGGTLLFGGASTFLFPYVPFSTTISSSTVRLNSSTALNSGNNLFNVATTASTFDLGGYHALIGGLSGLGTVTNSGGAPSILTLRTDSTTSFSGTFTDGTGTLALTKTGAGTQRLITAHAYTGATTVARGTLQLDFSAPTAPAFNIIATSSTLIMAGGILNQVGAATSTTPQTFNDTVITGGASTISQAQSSASSFATTLQLGDLSRTSAGATVNFVPSTAGPSRMFTTATLNSSNILGGWATVGGNDWATYGNDTLAFTPWIHGIAFSDIPYQNAFAPDTHTDMSFNLTAPSNGHTATLRFNNDSATLTLSGANVIDTGGILITSGGSGVSIMGPAATDMITSGNGADLIVHQHNPSSAFSIAATIADNGAAPIALTKAGAGTLVLTAPNTYSGGTFVTQGVIKLSAGASLGNGQVTLYRSGNQAPGGLLLSDGMTIPNTITLQQDDALFSPALIDVPPGASATLAGNVSAPAGPANQYRMGTSGGTLTFTGSHTAGSPEAGAPAPLVTVFWGSDRTNAVSQPPNSRVIFAGSSSLVAYRSPIFLSYVDLVLKDNATMTVVNPSSALGLRMGAGNSFANYQGGNILTLQDNAHLNLSDLSLDLNVNPSYGNTNLNLNGGSLTVGQFIRTNNLLPTTLRFNGTSILAGKDTAAFFPGTSSTVTALVALGGARFNTNEHAITIAIPLQHDSGLGLNADGGLVKLGNGTLTLSHPTNTYTGPTTVEQGRLVFSASRSTPLSGITGEGTVQVATGVSITSGAPVQVRELLLDGTLSISAGVGAGSTNTVHRLELGHTGNTYSALFTMPYGNLAVLSDTPAEKLAKIPDLQAAVRSGYNGGTWNGKGITITAAAFDPTHLTVGVFDNADLHLASLNGTPLDSNAILIAVAPLGDANLDQKVDALDLNLLAAHWQQAGGATSASADFNLDGAVNALDLNLLASNWQYGSGGSLELPSNLPALFPSAAPAVPEPASLLLMGMALSLVCRRRR